MTNPGRETPVDSGGAPGRRPLRVLIADDHEIVRRGVRGLIESRGWTVVGEAADGREAIAQAKKLTPDIVILDIAMPLLNGLDAAREIHKAVPSAALLMLTMYESEQMIRSILEAGAKGYVPKSEAAQYLVAAVEALASDRPFLSGRASRMLLDSYLQDPATPGVAKTPDVALTGREREVLQLLAEGKSNKQVAGLLNLAVKTVETHRSNIMRKLDLHNLVELIHYAVRNHLIDVEEPADGPSYGEILVRPRVFPDARPEARGIFSMRLRREPK